MSQEDITLTMLRQAGPHGVHTFEMRAAYIGNPSERIARLERRGHRIRVGPKERLNGTAVGVRYYLECDADHAATNLPSPPATFPIVEREPERESNVPPDLATGSLSVGLFDAGVYAAPDERYRDVAA